MLKRAGLIAGLFLLSIRTRAEKHAEFCVFLGVIRAATVSEVTKVTHKIDGGGRSPGQGPLGMRQPVSAPLPLRTGGRPAGCRPASPRSVTMMASSSRAAITSDFDEELTQRLRARGGVLQLNASGYSIMFGCGRCLRGWTHMPQFVLKHQPITCPFCDRDQAQQDPHDTVQENPQTPQDERSPAEQWDQARGGRLPYEAPGRLAQPQNS